MRRASLEKPVARNLKLYGETYRCLRPVIHDLEIASYSEAIRVGLAQYEGLICGAFDEKNPNLLFWHTQKQEIDVLNHLHALARNSEFMRLNVTLPPRTIERLKNLEIITKVPSELVIHRAVKLLEMIAEHSENFFLHYINGKITGCKFAIVPLPSERAPIPNLEAYLDKLRTVILHPGVT